MTEPTTESPPGAAPLDVLRASLRERLATARGVAPDALPPALLDIAVQRFDVGDPELLLVLPADWEQLRHEEGGAGRGVPYWARPWPSGLALARALTAAAVPPGARVLELGCGLGAPSIVAARRGATVLATDASSDATVFAAHALALNGVEAAVARVDWSADADALVAQGPFDVLLAADVLNTQANVASALRVWPALLAADGVVRLADPRRAGARDFLAAARGTFGLASDGEDGEVALHVLRPRRR